MIRFTVIAFDPRLVDDKRWRLGTPYLVVLLYSVHIRLGDQPLLLLSGGSGQGGVNEGVQLRPLV